jgi:hypothetical protein
MRGFETEFEPEMESPSFEPGDIVVLRSGGPDMTVIDVDPQTGDVHCVMVQPELENRGVRVSD